MVDKHTKKTAEYPPLPKDTGVREQNPKISQTLPKGRVAAGTTSVLSYNSLPAHAIRVALLDVLENLVRRLFVGGRELEH